MLVKERSNNRILSVFDFDGTLTQHDSFVPFLRFAFGRKVFLLKMFTMLVPTLRCIRGKMTRDELKESLIQRFLAGSQETWVQAQAKHYCERYWKKLMRPKGLYAVADELRANATVTICSASPELVLRPFADKLGIQLIGTQLEVKEGILTGKITGHNCRSAEKVARLRFIFGDLRQYHLRAWGDTRGDYELLSAAQDPHWRYFHRRKTVKYPAILQKERWIK